MFELQSTTKREKEGDEKTEDAEKKSRVYLLNH